MKQLMTSFLLGLTLLNADFATAGCSPYICGPIQHFDQSYCKVENDHLTGWTFFADGTANRIDSLAGMPNPNEEYRIEDSGPKSVFFVNRISKIDNEVLEIFGPFSYMSPSVIRFQNEYLNVSSCGMN